jgi:hypothetical protein
MYALVILSMFLVFPQDAGVPELLEGVKIQAGGEDINIKVGHLVPCVLDWNDDGKKDLLVGQFSGGKIRVYLNEGTDEEPVFNTFEYLKAKGKEISLPSG